MQLCTSARALIAGLALSVVLSVALSGCAAGPTGVSVDPGDPAAVRAALGDDFLGGNTSPSPEAVVTPAPGSWDGIEPRSGYRVAVLTVAGDPDRGVLTSALSAWAAEHGVQLSELVAQDDAAIEELAVGAVGTDLIIGAGSGVVDELSRMTPQHLDQNFLIVAAELPEPTANVTSVVWDGASFRGSGISAEGDLVVGAVTSERVASAVSAGVASVLAEHTGIVLYLDH